jgi:hypothetical protein
MNIIRLIRAGGVWHAQYAGPHAVDIVDLFGTDTIPTAYRADMPPAAVLAAVRARHTDRDGMGDVTILVRH